jgi:hypothetical protein
MTLTVDTQRIAVIFVVVEDVGFKKTFEAFASISWTILGSQIN